MVKRLVTFFVLLASFCNLTSQSNAVIVPYLDGDKWGFMNSEKQVVVSPIYDEAYPPFNQMARVKKGKKYGYVNMEGKESIRCQYNEAEDFRYGIAQVSKRGKASVIKTNGKKNNRSIGVCGTHPCLLAKISKKIQIYQEDGAYGIYHNQANRYDQMDSAKVDTLPPIWDTIIPVTHQLMYVVSDGLGCFIHEGSNLSHKITQIEYQYEDIQLFDCGFCSSGKNSIIGIKKDGLWGYIRSYYPQIHSITPFQYLSISSFASGYALVEYAPYRFGYVDGNGVEYFFRD